MESLDGTTRRQSPTESCSLPNGTEPVMQPFCLRPRPSLADSETPLGSWMSEWMRFNTSDSLCWTWRMCCGCFPRGLLMKSDQISRKRPSNARWAPVFSRYLTWGNRIPWFGIPPIPGATKTPHPITKTSFFLHLREIKKLAHLLQMLLTHSQNLYSPLEPTP